MLSKIGFTTLHTTNDNVEHLMQQYNTEIMDMKDCNQNLKIKKINILL